MRRIDVRGLAQMRKGRLGPAPLQGYDAAQVQGLEVTRITL
jgi:hypothetical protein